MSYAQAVRDGVYARLPRHGVQRQPCRAMHYCPHCRLFNCNITAAGLAALLAGVRASPSRLEELMCVHVQLGYGFISGLRAAIYSRKKTTAEA